MLYAVPPKEESIGGGLRFIGEYFYFAAFYNAGEVVYIDYKEKWGKDSAVRDITGDLRWARVDVTDHTLCFVLPEIFNTV